MSKVFEEAKRHILRLADKTDHERAVKEDAVRKFIMSTYPHKPGTTHRLSDGTTYLVLPSGAWKRTSERPCNEPSLGYHTITNKSKYRRLMRLA